MHDVLRKLVGTELHCTECSWISRKLFWELLSVHIA